MKSIVIYFAIFGAVLNMGWCDGESEEIPTEEQLMQWFFDKDDVEPEADRIFGKYKEVCYGKYGCFSTEPPFSAPGRIAWLPDRPEKLPLKYLLFTRETRQTGYELTVGNTFGLQNSAFNPHRPTKMIINGWNDFHYWPLHLKDSFLRYGDYNVISVRVFDGRVSYGKSAGNSRVFGALIAEFVEFLIVEAGANLADIHIMGHSLGAHVAAYAGERLMPGPVRITGLDPAGPMFRDTHPKVRLDETDGDFVDILHTDGHLNILMRTGWGLSTPSGHVDVYANGGNYQPGCDDKRWIPTLIKGLIDDGLTGAYDAIRYIGGCHHTRGYMYPNESLSHDSVCPYKAYRCDGGWKEFQTGRCLRCPTGVADPSKYCNGYLQHAVKPSDGSVNNGYYFSTGPERPFCRFHYHVQLELQDTKNHDQKGDVWVKFFADNGASTGFLKLGEDSFSLKKGGKYDFLVLSTQGMPNINALELKWEHNAKFYDITQWQFTKPTIYPKRVTVFSGEYQTESIFDDTTNTPLKTKGTRKYTKNN